MLNMSFVTPVDMHQQHQHWLCHGNWLEIQLYGLTLATGKSLP